MDQRKETPVNEILVLENKEERVTVNDNDIANSHYHAHSLRIKYYVNCVRRTNVQHTDTKSSNHSEIISHNLYSTLLCTTNHFT